MPDVEVLCDGFLLKRSATLAVRACTPLDRASRTARACLHQLMRLRMPAERTCHGSGGQQGDRTMWSSLTASPSQFNWNKRYFALSNETLMYAENRQSPRKKVYNLADCRAAEEDGPCKIQVHCPMEYGVVRIIMRPKCIVLPLRGPVGAQRDLGQSDTR